jgi:hypothetical protein
MPGLVVPANDADGDSVLAAEEGTLTALERPRITLSP